MEVGTRGRKRRGGGEKALSCGAGMTKGAAGSDVTAGHVRATCAPLP